MKAVGRFSFLNRVRKLNADASPTTDESSVAPTVAEDTSVTNRFVSPAKTEESSVTTITESDQELNESQDPGIGGTDSEKRLSGQTRSESRESDTENWPTKVAESTSTSTSEENFVSCNSSANFLFEDSKDDVSVNKSQQQYQTEKQQQQQQPTTETMALKTNGNHIIEEDNLEEEERDDIGALGSNNTAPQSNGTDATEVKVAFKNWYRRASVSKQLTAVETAELDIPIHIAGQDGVDGPPAPGTRSRSETDPQQPETEADNKEQEILNAISRRLSISTSSPMTSAGFNPTGLNGGVKTGKVSIGGRRASIQGSVPQARMLKGNVKNRKALFEN